jgi:hypothetical protein
MMPEDHGSGVPPARAGNIDCIACSKSPVQFDHLSLCPAHASPNGFRAAQRSLHFAGGKSRPAIVTPTYFSDIRSTVLQVWRLGSPAPLSDVL